MKLIRIEPKSLSESSPAFERMPADELHLWLFQETLLAGDTERRAALRRVLEKYLGAAVLHAEFELQGQGKPALPSALNTQGVFFNLSHTSDWFAVAVTRIGEVGVDIEKVRPMSKLEAFVDRFFLPSEAARTRTQVGEARLKEFFRIWTAKEAWAKARAFSVFAATRQYEWNPRDPELIPFEVGEGILGHVCVRGRSESVPTTR